MGRWQVVNARWNPLSPALSTIHGDGGRITAVTERSFVDVDAETIDAYGASVFPGIDDSHCHAYLLGRSLLACDLLGSQSVQELGVRLQGASPEASGWIRARGWDGTRISGSGPGGQLCAADLDQVWSERPVICYDQTGHQALCNSAALRAAAVDRNTPDPTGGVIVRDASGAPTGLLLEAAVANVNAVIPAVSEAEQRMAILTAQRELHRNGVTAITDPGLGPGAPTLMDGSGDLRAVAAYRALADGDELRLRTTIMLLFGGLGGTTAEAVASGLDTWGPPDVSQHECWVQVNQVKVFADGIPRSRTAWLSEPYDDCSCGHLQVSGFSDADKVQELHDIVAAAASRGWQTGAHSIGDRAISSYIDAVAATGTPELRHYVIHGDLVQRSDLDRMHRLSMGLNTNPSIRWQVGHRVDSLLGVQRNTGRQPLADAVAARVNLAFSSDSPVASPNWQLISAAAMSRNLSDDPHYTDRQVVDSTIAVHALTMAGAWQSRSESWRGQLAIGQVADLIVMDRAVSWEEPWSITEAKIARTIVGGNQVYAA